MGTTRYTASKVRFNRRKHSSSGCKPNWLGLQHQTQARTGRASTNGRCSIRPRSTYGTGTPACGSRCGDSAASLCGSAGARAASARVLALTTRTMTVGPHPRRRKMQSMKLTLTQKRRPTVHRRHQPQLHPLLKSRNWVLHSSHPREKTVKRFCRHCWHANRPPDQRLRPWLQARLLQRAAQARMMVPSPVAARARTKVAPRRAKMTTTKMTTQKRRRMITLLLPPFLARTLQSLEGSRLLVCDTCWEIATLSCPPGRSAASQHKPPLRSRASSWECLPPRALVSNLVATRPSHTSRM